MGRQLTRSGDPYIWLCGGALALILVLLLGLFFIIAQNALPALWPAAVVELKLVDGTVLLGEVAAREKIPSMDGSGAADSGFRLQIKRGNRDIYGSDFVWVDESKIALMNRPEEAMVLEREQWGNFYGFPLEMKDGDSRPDDRSDLAAQLALRLASVRRLVNEIHEIETHEAASLANRQERLRMEVKRAEARGNGKAANAAKQKLVDLEDKYRSLEEKLSVKRTQLSPALVLHVAGGNKEEISLSQIVRAYQPNRMTTAGQVSLYSSRVIGFLLDAPRESNTEGGVFPAIFGTVMMVMLMSLAATPLGVLAAVYLHEYARQGRFVSLVRIAVNNLAGVPSIVFGVFGLGFFVYYLGGGIDRLFFSEYLPNPTFGTGGLLWASLTLALLTMPTVIVATEEGLAAIPRALREASYALGATKWETTSRVVLPNLIPSILTGLILAVARAAGEVAPLMITGVVKLAPSLPVDASWPFFHFDRKFMHLGFHVYDVGFQSPNVDAARPVVYTTTILLLAIVVLLNAGAIIVRNRLRKTFSSAGV